MGNVWLVIKLVMQIWGEEIFTWLEAQVAKTDNGIDDMLVKLLKGVLMPSGDTEIVEIPKK